MCEGNEGRLEEVYGEEGVCCDRGSRIEGRGSRLRGREVGESAGLRWKPFEEGQRNWGGGKVHSSPCRGLSRGRTGGRSSSLEEGRLQKLQS